MNLSTTTPIGVCRMAVSLLEILRPVPNRHRWEGQRFELATVLTYAVLGMVAGANSYRRLHAFVHVHRRRLNEAFHLNLRYAPSYSGLRLILQGIDPTAREKALRRHAASLPNPPSPKGPTAVAIEGKTRRGRFPLKSTIPNRWTIIDRC